MAYNNVFPVSYQPYYQPTYQTATMANQQNNQQQQNSGIIWVQGEAGAKSYLVAPNTTVQLWDSENQVIYLKSADASGMPSMKTLEYTVRGSEGLSQAFKGDSHEFVLKDDFKGLQGELEALKRDVNKIKHARVKLTKIQEGDDYE